MSPLRVVLDTNVLLSSLLFRRGDMVWFCLAWQSGDIRPLASQATVEELLRVLSYPKFRFTAADREELLEHYLPWCEVVAVPDTVEVPDCRDFWDRPFLALADKGQADALITGGKDLLVLGETFSVPILKPAEFRSRMLGTQYN